MRPCDRNQRVGQGDVLEPAVDAGQHTTSDNHTDMKRIVAAALAIIAALALTAPPAGAKPKPVKTTLYMHGYSPSGEIDGIDWRANGSKPMQMDATEPAADPIPKSQILGTPGLNTRCTGFPTAFPTWVGNISGTIVGDAKLTAYLVGGPSQLTARLWVDVPVFSCNEGYIDPHAEVTVPIPPGQSEVVVDFPKLKLKASSLIMVQLLPVGIPRNRVLYDSASAPTGLTFSCVPARGKSCV